MTRVRHRLSALEVSKASDPGFYPDGGNLYLKVTSTGSKSWIFRFTMSGRTRDAGLGAFPTINLATARKEAESCRVLVQSGVDPVEARREERSQKQTLPGSTFRECAEAFIQSHEAGWKNDKHRAQWRSTLTTYAYPKIGSQAADAVTTNLVLEVLEPIWSSKPETASRVRGRIESVLDWAKVKGFRSGENPARWRGHLDHLLPSKNKVRRVVHHTALPYKQLPKFIKKLREVESVGARCLEFLILTCARTSEATGADWSEIDFKTRLWIVPAARMKGGKEHRVPLSDRAIEILREMEPLAQRKAGARIGLVFPGVKPGRPLSQMTLAMVLRRMKVNATVHGFRSSFRDWAAEETTFSREAAEMALAHAIPNAVEAAYRRGDLLEQRRKLAAAWRQYCG